MTPPLAAPSAAPAASPAGDRFYHDALERLVAAQVPFLVGGAYGLSWMTGIAPRTKDLDLFVLPRDCDQLLDVLRGAGYAVEIAFPHWLAKVRCGRETIDVIFSSGNGEAAVDEEWFARSVAAEVCGVPVRLCPIEETIWSKAFIMERERFDGADILHLLRAAAERIDWPHLVQRFALHWPVLLVHLLLFGYVYPGERHRLPAELVSELLARTARDWGAPPPDPRLCRGPLLSRAQYLVDVADWGYHDARLRPYGHLDPDEVAAWTDAAPSLPRAGTAATEPEERIRR